MINVNFFVVSCNGFAAEVMDLLIIRIFIYDDVITFGEIILTLEAIKKVESFIKIGDAKDIYGTKNGRKYKEWNFDGWLDFAVDHENAKTDGNDCEDSEGGYKICVW